MTPKEGVFEYTGKVKVCGRLLRYNIGQFGMLSLKLTKFDPSSIVCKGLSRPVASECTQILNEMPATDRLELFGPRDVPDVDIPLPFVIHTTRE